MAFLARAAFLAGVGRHLVDAAGLIRATSSSAVLQASGGSVSAAVCRAFCSADATTAAGGADTEETEDAAAVEGYRTSKNFRRRLDGRVQLHGKESGSWLEAKLDGYVEGSLLLRGRDGHVYYLVSEDLKQIDLSNDQLVGQLFGEGGWEKLMQPLYTQAQGGDLKHVRMTPQQFRSIFTVLREAPPPSVEA